MSARSRSCIASMQTAPLLLFSASIGMRRRIADRMPRAATFARFEAAHRARSRCREKKLRGAVDTVKNRDYVSPSRRFLRKQVSKIISTTRTSIPTSARTVKTVDAGSLSPAKWFGAMHGTIFHIQPGPPSTDRVFVCRGSVMAIFPPAAALQILALRMLLAAGRAVSVSTCFARWRLVAGSPAALFSTGPYTPIDH